MNQKSVNRALKSARKISISTKVKKIAFNLGIVLTRKKAAFIWDWYLHSSTEIYPNNPTKESVELAVKAFIKEFTPEEEQADQKKENKGLPMKPAVPAPQKPSEKPETNQFETPAELPKTSITLSPSHIIDHKIYESIKERRHEPFQLEWEANHEGITTRSRPLSIHLEMLSLCDIKLENKTDTVILEIGGGFGRTLLEMKELHPDIHFISIGAQPWLIPDEVIYERINQIFNIINPLMLEQINVPPTYKYRIVDSIPFIQSNSVDHIISIYTYNAIPRCDLLTLDMWRILKPGGSLAIPDLNGLTHNGKETTFWEYLQSLGYTIKQHAKRNTRRLVKDRETLEHHVIPTFKDNKIIGYETA